ncbi:MAG TPA: alginate export family protein [Candidatus Acidoferrales bacterium]|nr:alginate export family protein [Candidatus Acidoferrales bacterium]
MKYMGFKDGRTGLLFGAAAILLLAGSALGQTATDNTFAPAEPGWFYRYLARTVRVGASLRIRWESGQGSDFRTTPAPWYLLTRARLHAAFRPLSWLQIAAEGQDARAPFYRLKPSGSLADPLDLRQAYVQFGGPEDTVMGRIGRQELTLGSGRLIASLDWGNTARLFDVADAQLNRDAVKLELVAGSIVQIDPDRMNRHKPGEHFYAAYSTLPRLLPLGKVEPYVIYKTQLNVKSKDGVLGDAGTLALGGRVTGATPLGLDYSVEAIRELGTYSSDLLRGIGFVGGAGYRLAALAGKPRFSAEYMYASGDDGRRDGHRETFDNMYGFNQPANSLTGQFGWRNLKEGRFGVELQPVSRLKANFDFRDFSLANTQDGLYNALGVRTVFNPKATSAHVGFGPDTQVSFAVRPATSIGVGVGTLFPGEYLRQSGKNTGFFYPYAFVSRKFGK